MGQPVKRIIIRILKYSGIGVVAVLALLFLLPIVFPGKIAQEVKTFANQHLNGKLNFKKAHLSFFRHFPSLTLSLTDFSLTGSTPYKDETLLSANEIAFGIDVKKLIFYNKININKIIIADALINVKVDAQGAANYNVYKADSSSNSTGTDSANTSLRLEKIVIKNSRLSYDDQSAKILITANGINYTGNGDLNKSVFDLYTEAGIEDFNLTYDGEQYLKNKKVNASLITKINTNSLAFVFEKNDLKINKLPVEFKGKFDFLSNGYDLDFSAKSTNSSLNDFFTALPPAYVTWLDKAKVKGTTDLIFSLKGKYIAAQNQAPDMAFAMKIRDGFVNYSEAPIAASNIFLNFETRLPQLNPEKLSVNIDSIFFNVGSDYVKAIIKTNGLSKPNIDARVDAAIDLAKMSRSFGLPAIDLRGLLNAKINTKGMYDRDKHIIPATNGTVSFKNGYIKTPYYPNAITDMDVMLSLEDKTGTMKDLKLNLAPASFNFEGKPVYIKASLSNFENIVYDIEAKGELDLARIYKVFSTKGLELEGLIKADLSLKGSQQDAMKGNYHQLQNKGTLQLRNIQTTSQYLPKPFVIKDGLFTFNQDKMNFTNFRAVYGQSDFTMNGYMQNVIDFMLTDIAVLKGNFNINSNYINVDEFRQGATVDTSSKQTTAAGTGVAIVPPNFDLQLNALVNKIDFEELKIENLRGNLVINKGRVQLQQSGFDLIGCRVNMDVTYANKSTQTAAFDFKVKADSFDVSRAYKEVKMFREMATAAKDAQGIISLNYQVAGVLDENMQPIYPSLTGGGTLSVKKVKLKGYKLFNIVGGKTGKDAIKNPDLSEVKINTKIKNNVIEVERFKFKVAGFRPRIEGKTSFDGKLAIKMRLGLPPLGIIGIPLTVTGTQDNPKVKIGKKTDELPETEYDEDVPKPSQTTEPAKQ
ncbi:MAG: AsmA-like C-terminal region-containing protein [Ferruginibacter sp.]